jgi:hypothetical protein
MIEKLFYFAMGIVSWHAFALVAAAVGRTLYERRKRQFIDDLMTERDAIIEALRDANYRDDEQKRFDA